MLKKISFKITLKSVKIYTTFYGFRNVIPHLGAETEKARSP